MEKTNNEWLRMNIKKIEALQYKLTELAYKNEHSDVPIGEMRGMIGAAVVEIGKLQETIDILKSDLKNNNSDDVSKNNFI